MDDFSNEKIMELKYAKNLLENPGLAIKLSNLIGAPIEKGINMLPEKVVRNMNDVTQKALLKAADAAIFTMKDKPWKKSSDKLHKTVGTLTGAVGGCFGLGGLAVELPVSTTIMLRSIADIARSEGESISDIETKLACLEVFAFGGNSVEDDGAESAYYAVRYALTAYLTEAFNKLSQKGISKGASSAIVKFISKIAERFGVQVTQKAAAQALPALGAIGGGAVNMLFIDHFQNMARGHFIVRRLEREFEKELVKEQYDKIKL